MDRGPSHKEFAQAVGEAEHGSLGAPKRLWLVLRALSRRDTHVARELRNGIASGGEAR